jgi:hypothetical protein
VVASPLLLELQATTSRATRASEERILTVYACALFGASHG